MEFLARVFRATALLLLLYTGADFIACDLLAVVPCEQDSASDQAQSGDDCFCCCTHVVIPRPDPLIAHDRISVARSEVICLQPTCDRPSIYHPPRA